MMMWKKCCTPGTGLLVLRVVLGVIFIAHGWAKIQAMDGTIGFFGTLGFAPFWAYVVAWSEFLGGIALVIGMFSKISAVLLSITMLVVILSVKSGAGITGPRGIELELSLLGGLVAIMLSGPGKWAIGPKMCPCCKGGTCKSDGCMCHHMCDSGTCGGGTHCDNCSMCQGGCTKHEKN